MDDELIGKKLGPYVIQGVVGSGGMGVVYRATEPSLNRVVAIKVLPPLLARNEEFLKRFEREARSAAQINHPNVVHIYAQGQDGKHHYIVMELVRGGDLAALIEARGRLEVREALDFARQAAGALSAAHEMRIIHRDIKPHNMLVDAAGHLKVMDFGIAKAVAETSKITAGGHVLGTADYMSPEQCKGEPPDPRTDIYSLGVVLYQMLAGSLPHKADTPLAMLRKIVDEAPIPITSLRPDVPPAVVLLIERALAKDKLARFPSAAAMEEEIKRLLYGPEALPWNDAPATQRLPETNPSLSSGIAKQAELAHEATLRRPATPAMAVPAASAPSPPPEPTLPRPVTPAMPMSGLPIAAPPPREVAPQPSLPAKRSLANAVPWIVASVAVIALAWVAVGKKNGGDAGSGQQVSSASTPIEPMPPAPSETAIPSPPPTTAPTLAPTAEPTTIPTTAPIATEIPMTPPPTATPSPPPTLTPSTPPTRPPTKPPTPTRSKTPKPTETATPKPTESAPPPSAAPPQPQSRFAPSEKGLVHDRALDLYWIPLTDSATDGPVRLSGIRQIIENMQKLYPEYRWAMATKEQVKSLEPEYGEFYKLLNLRGQKDFWLAPLPTREELAEEKRGFSLSLKALKHAACQLNRPSGGQITSSMNITYHARTNADQCCLLLVASKTKE